MPEASDTRLLEIYIYISRVIAYARQIRENSIVARLRGHHPGDDSTKLLNLLILHFAREMYS